MECKNCQFTFDGYYCPHCGQRVIAFHTWKTVGHYLLGAFDLERGYLYTTWNLIAHPSKFVNQYISGSTIRAINPVKYLLLNLGALFLFLGLPELFLETETMVGTSPLARISFYSLILVAVIPLAALNLFLFVRGQIMRYLDFLIVSLYLCGFILIILCIQELVAVPIHLHYGDPNNWQQWTDALNRVEQIFNIPIVLYSLYFLMKVFKGTKKYVSRVMLAWIIFVAMMSVIVMGVSALDDVLTS